MESGSQSVEKRIEDQPPATKNTKKCQDQ